MSSGEPLYVQVIGRATRDYRLHNTALNEIDTHNVEAYPDAALYFTGEQPVTVGVPSDGEPALMARMIDLLVRKRLR